MDTQTKTILALLARHFLGWMAGALAARGYLDASMTEGFISAGMMIATVIWSWWQKSGQAKVAAELALLKAWRTTSGAGGAPIGQQYKAPTTAAAVQAAMAQQKKP